MHRRFSRARRARIAAPDGVVEVAVAESFRLRLIGLMGLEPKDVEPLLFPRCRSIHTYGMKTPIDIVWLENDGENARTLGVVEGLRPRSHLRAPAGGGAGREVAALELAPGYAERLGFRARTIPPNP